MATSISLSDGGVAPSAQYPWTISGAMSVGDAVAVSAAGSKTIVRADADNASARPPIGIVTAISGTQAQVALNGEVASGLSGLTRGATYYLSTTAGALTSSAPGSNIYPVGVALSATELLVDSSQADLAGGGGGGATVTSVGITSSDFTVSNSPVTTSGTIGLSLNTVGIADGGTGQTTASAAFDALSPTTTKGDLIVYDGTDAIRLPVGANGRYLKANSALSAGMEWAEYGTVTSVAVSSSDSAFTVTNSPVTTSGTVGLALNTVSVAKGGTGLTSASEQGAMPYATSTSAYTMQSVSPTFKNRIINGGMNINQRTPGNVTANGAFIVDRWINSVSSGATAYAVQSAVVPSGFSNSILFNVATGSTSTALQYAQLGYVIEGTSVPDLAWGTASAKPIVISFWVRSSLTGTYCVGIRNSAYNRSYIAQYTIASANTWEYKTLSIAGDTTGTWLTSNGRGLQLNWDLGSGSTYRSTAGSWLAGEYFTTASQANLIGTNNSTFYLTGVQLEVGSVATNFELRPEQVELALCQRYFSRLDVAILDNFMGVGVCTSTSNALAYFKYPVTMRSTPTMTATSIGVLTPTLIKNPSATLQGVNYGSDSVAANFSSSSLTAGRVAIMYAVNTSAVVSFSAEL